MERTRGGRERAQIEMPRTGENSLNLPLHISIPLPSEHMHQKMAPQTHFFLNSGLLFGTQGLFLGLACIQFGIMRCCVCQGPPSYIPPFRYGLFHLYLWSSFTILRLLRTARINYKCNTVPLKAIFSLHVRFYYRPFSPFRREGRDNFSRDDRE